MTGPDNDKENDSRTGGGQSTQGVIQRRRRPKRRSTGVVHIDMDVSICLFSRITDAFSYDGPVLFVVLGLGR